MNYIHRLEHWGDTHHPKWLDFVRMALGLFLVYMGIAFLTNISGLIPLMEKKVPFSSGGLVLLTHLIVFLHITGGILLALGLYTRFAAIIQIPILLGAVIFLSSNHDALRPYGQIVLSLVVLILLIVFAIEGNGPLSFKVPSDEPPGHEDYIDKYPG
jgi:putative oxidoreductase